MFQPFGSEISFLNRAIITATHTKFDLTNKTVIKLILKFTGLPHFGARIRAFYLNRLLNQISSHSKLLDVGCGIGLNSFLAARKGIKTTGVDIEKEKISIAKLMLSKVQYPHLRFKLDDATKLTFQNESFDCVICIEVLEHIDKDEKALSEISRALRKNGFLFLSVPGIGLISKINQHSKHHVREGYSLKELRRKLHTANLEITKVIKIEHTLLGFGLRYLNDEIHRRSLLATTLLFPIFFPLAILDGFLPEMITPNNWIIVAKKERRG